MPVIGSPIPFPLDGTAHIPAAQIPDLSATYGAVPAVADVATMYVTAAGSDANDGLSWKRAKATIGACQTAFSAGALTVLLGAGTLATQSFTVDRDGLTVVGMGKTATTLRWDSVGPAITNSSPATMRRDFTMSGVHLYLQFQPTAGVGIAWDNFYRGALSNVWIDQLGVNGTGLKIIGAAAKSSYMGTFRDVDVTSGGFCVSIGDNCNGHEFFGGVLDGAGIAINIQPVSAVSGESKWFGTRIQTSNTRTANVGGGGAIANNHEFYGLRVETGVAASWVFSGGQGKNCLILGGTFSGCTVNAGAAADVNTILIPSAGTMFFAQNTNLVVGSGGANQMTVTASDLIQQGTNASVNMGLSAKGAAAVTVNARASSGTAGFQVYDGAASPAVAVGMSAAGVLSGKKLGANATVTGSRAGNAALASLLTALAGAGIIVDTTTA